MHTSMTSTFQFEFIASFESKTLTILTLKLTSHGYMYCQYNTNTNFIVNSPWGLFRDKY